MNDIHDHPVFRRIALVDDAGLTQLYRDHAQVLYNLAVRVLHPASDAGGAVIDLLLSLRTAGPAGSGAHTASRTELISRMRDILVGQATAGSHRHSTRDVDLWSLVSRPVPDRDGMGAVDAQSVAAARSVLRKSGAVSTSVLSLVYFSGLSIAAAAARMSISPAECRSRLHGCLERLSTPGPVDRDGLSDHGRFSVCASAHSLGAITAAEEPEFFDHIAGGCAECEADFSRFHAAAHFLPMLLSDSVPPRDLSDRFQHSLKLARSLPPPPPVTDAGGPAGFSGEEAGVLEDDGPSESAEGPAIAPPGRPARFRAALIFATIALIALLAMYSRSLMTRLDEQKHLVGALQDSQTDLLANYHRLAGISGFFESKGMVSVLMGSEEHPDLAGKLVWDTARGNAMLQLLNLPAGGRRFEVRAAGDGASAPIAEFRRDGRDTGKVLYRFFEVSKGEPFAVETITVSVFSEEWDGSGAYRSVLEGKVPGRN